MFVTAVIKSKTVPKSIASNSASVWFPLFHTTIEPEVSTVRSAKVYVRQSYSEVPELHPLPPYRSGN